MAKTAVLGSHTSSQRDSWWYLSQHDDGSVWVRYENDDDHNDDWEKPLQEVLVSGPAGAKERVEAWIGRMLEKKDA